MLVQNAARERALSGSKASHTATVIQSVVPTEGQTRGSVGQNRGPRDRPLQLILDRSTKANNLTINDAKATGHP